MTSFMANITHATRKSPVKLGGKVKGDSQLESRYIQDPFQSNMINLSVCACVCACERAYESFCVLTTI